MATIDKMSDTIEGSERLLEQISLDLHRGHFGEAHSGAALLLDVLDGQLVDTCVVCAKPLTEDEINRFTSWCEHDAPTLDLRFTE